MEWNIKRGERKKKGGEEVGEAGHSFLAETFSSRVFTFDLFIYLSFRETGWHAPTLEPRSSLGN